MGTTSSLKALSVPTVAGDSGTWGNELNATIGDLDTILGGSITFNSSASATVTLSTSQAQMNRIVFSGTPASSMALFFSSAAGSFGNYGIWNATSTSANGGAGFNILASVTSTSTGATVTIPISNMRQVNVDGQNVQFADQVIVPITSLPPVLNNYLAGLGLSNNSSMALNIAAGIATDTTATTYLQNAASFTKSASAVWAVGSGNGGMGSGLTFTAATWYHVFIISNGTSSNIDFYFDTSATAANKPSNTNYFRRIGSMFATSSAANWATFSQNGDEFIWPTTVGDVNGLTPGTASRTLYILTVPTGIKVNALFRAVLGVSGATNPFLIFTSPDETDQAPGSNPSAFDITCINTIDGASRYNVRTNTSAQIGARQFGAASLFVGTYGWIDTRGKNVVP